MAFAIALRAAGVLEGAVDGAVARRIERLARKQFGVVSRVQALAAGMSPTGVRRRVGSGAWTPLLPGVYALAGSPRTVEQQLMTATLWAGREAVLSFSTAAYVWGLFPFGVPIHLSAPSKRASAHGLEVHSRAVLERLDVTRRGPFPVTTPARTLVDLASMMGPAELGPRLDAALRSGVVSIDRLHRAFGRLARPGKKGTATFRHLLEMRVPGAAITESHLEDKVERRILRAGLPRPVRQHEVYSGSTFVGRLDFAYPSIRLGIEVDGYAYHSGDVPFHRDRKRWNRFFDAGWSLRFATADEEGLEELVAQLTNDLVIGGLLPGG